MKLKLKLPLLFLAMFFAIYLIFFAYLRLYLFSGLILDRPLPRVFDAQNGREGLTFLLLLLGVVFLLLVFYAHFKITRPIARLNERMVGLGAGRGVPAKRPKAGHDEIGELQNRFYEMEDRLCDARRERVDMISAIAHDIKTPLTSINGFVELLCIQSDLSDEERREYYGLILKKSRHIAELIGSFSAFTSEDAALSSLGFERRNALRLFESIRGEYEAELSGLGHNFFSGSGFSGDEYILADEHMLRRVFGNLFSNAVRHAGRSPLCVYMCGGADDGEVWFKIEDDGAGVPEEDLPSLFRLFYTVDKARQIENGGAGLGLASCKSIIERHGGFITAYISDKGGLGVRFSIPRA